VPARLVLYPSGRAIRFLVMADGESLAVGRDPGCELVLDDPKVSKRHARLSWDGEGWLLEDLGSKNGTSLNGAPAAGQRLAGADWVSFGGVQGQFQLVTEDEARALREERLARLQTSVDRRRHLSAGQDALDLLQRLLESAMDVIRADRGFVLVAGPSGDLRAELVAGFTAHDLASERFAGSSGAVEEALRRGEPVVASDLRVDRELGARPSVVQQGLGALACIPLRLDDGGRGVLYVDGRTPGAVVTDLDVEILEGLAEHAALLLGSLRIERQIREVLGASDPGLLDALARVVEPALRVAEEPA
jgi:hypothetical protein